jgi:N-acetylglucosamine kinase-like BadF-type ATPase
MSPSTSWFIGVDGGGTKTHVVITDENDQIIAEAQADGSNLHKEKDYVRHSLVEAISRVKKAALSITSEMPKISLCFGLSGLDTQADQQHAKLLLKEVINECGLKPTKTLYCSDGLIGLFSQESIDWGVCIIASTGSNCFGLNKSGDRSAAAGDWGYLFGDQGSAFHIGQSLIQQALKEHDGRSNDSGLMKHIEKHLNLNSTDEIIGLAYQHPIQIKKIASLSTILPLISSTDANALVEAITNHHLQSCQAVVKRTEIDANDHIPIIFIGGLFKHQPFADHMSHVVTKAFPSCTIYQPAKPPVFGAIRLLKIHHLPTAKKLPLYSLE